MKNHFLILLILISCNNKKNLIFEKNYLKSREISIDTRVDNKINLSEVFSCVTYIKLESNTFSTIGTIGKMIVFDRKFYIHDIQTSKILVFDNNGKYIFQLSKKGRGPGEYLTIADFLVDSVSKKIEILDDGNQKVLIYDKMGNFINERKYTFWVDQFEKLSENTYLYFFNNYPTQPDVEKSYNVLIVDSLSTVITSYLPISEYLGMKVGEQKFLQKFGNGINVLIPYDNQIYHIKPNGYSVKYKINFKNYAIPDSFYEEYIKAVKIAKNQRTQAIMQFIQKINQGEYAASIQNIFENQEYLTFQYAISNKGTFTVFLKKSNDEILTGMAENDLDYGLYGTPLFILKDTLFSYFPAADLIERSNIIDSENLPTKNDFIILKKLTESLNENDNPIIAKFILK